jgi:drug/metabolite transporter (DMT)-like permease
MYLSEILAIAAAICIATSGMLISELTGRVHVLRLARWQLTAAFVMTAIVSVALGGWRNVTLVEFGYLAASSLFGIVIASTTYFATIYSIGPRLTALMFSLTSPFALALGYLAFGETITLKQGGGIMLVLAGIVLAIGLPGRRGPSRKALQVKASWLGIGLGIVTAFGQALGSLFARPAMAAGTEPFTAMAIRSGLGAIFFTLIAVLPMPAWRQPYAFSLKMLLIAVIASFFGTGLGMSLLMAALAHGNVGIVSTLSSMTPIVIPPMVWARTGKRPAATAWAGAALAVIGTALISL